MKRQKLEIPYIDLLPKPPTIVEHALHHWLEFLRFESSVGPRPLTTCGSIEKDYRHITRKLQAQYHPQDPDEKAMYDYWLGRNVDEDMMPKLLPIRRAIIKNVHLEHWYVDQILKKHRLTEPQFVRHLESGYNHLAGQLARRALRK